MTDSWRKVMAVPYEEIPKDEDSVTKKFMTSKEGVLKAVGCPIIST